MTDDANAQRVWYALDVFADPAVATAVEYGLLDLEAIGTEINLMGNKNPNDFVVVGYFLHQPSDHVVHDFLRSAVRDFGYPEHSIKRTSWRIVEDQDWLAEWKKHWKPTYIGRFVIAAPWHEVNELSEFVIRIEPNMAFGTGTHETTQLCLKAIDENYKPGQSFLDVGTGTGILAIAAARLATASAKGLKPGSLSNNVATVPNVLRSKSSVFSAGKILACDTDDQAVAIACENAEMNGVGSQIKFFTGPISQETDRFDFVCANLTADVIIPILPLLIEKTRETLVMSGILAEQEEAILIALPTQLKGKRHVTRLGEWISVTVRVG